MPKILLIESDQSTVRLLTDTLNNQGYAVSTVLTIQEGLEQASASDLILLNPGLAELGTPHPCYQLRSRGYHKPILLLLETATTEGIFGLDAGADDYVVKPYKLPDLLARVRALLRRQDPLTAAQPTLLQWGELVLNSGSAEVSYRGVPLALTPKEFKLLELFLCYPRRVFSRTTILDHIWGFATSPQENTVTNHIKELRQKLKAAGMTVDILETIYGLGYRLKPPPDISTVSRLPSLTLPGLPPPGEFARPRVLIVGQDPTVCSALQYLLQPWGFDGTVLREPAQIWETLATVTPDLLILDLDPSHPQGLDLCRSVRQHQQWGNLLILVITADTNAEAIQRAFVAGADDFVGKPIVGPELVTRVASRLEQRRSRPSPAQATLPFSPGPIRAQLDGVQSTYGNILLVDDQQENLQTLSKILSRQGYKVRKALRGATALDAVDSQKPDLVVLDIRMPEMDGYEVCAQLKADAATRDIPILFLSALDDTTDKLKAFAVGGADYITKPFQAEEVLARIKHQLIILQQKRQLTERNRQLQREIQERQQSQLTLEQMQLALWKSEAQFQCLFDRAAIALALIGTDHRWLRVNAALCALLGYAQAELLGAPVLDCLELTGAQGGPEWKQVLSQAQTLGSLTLICCSKRYRETRLSCQLWVLEPTQTTPQSLVAQFQALPG